MEASLGSRIRAARLKLHVSQPTLGRHCGVHPITISRWERNLVVPDSANLLKASSFLGVSIGWLLTGDEETQALQPEGIPSSATFGKPKILRQPAPGQVQVNAYPEDVKVLSKLRQLGPEDRDAVEGMIDRLLAPRSAPPAAAVPERSA